MLESLELRKTGDFPGTPVLSDDFFNAPKLQRLRLDGVMLNGWDSNLFSHLHSLELQSTFLQLQDVPKLLSVFNVMWTCNHLSSATYTLGMTQYL